MQLGRVRARVRVRVRVKVKVRVSHQVRQLLGRAHASTTLGERHARHLESLEIEIAFEIAFEIAAAATAAAATAAAATTAAATAAAAATVDGPTSIACVPDAPTPHLLDQRAQLDLCRRHAIVGRRHRRIRSSASSSGGGSGNARSGLGRQRTWRRVATGLGAGRGARLGCTGSQGHRGTGSGAQGRRVGGTGSQAWATCCSVPPVTVGHLLRPGAKSAPHRHAWRQGVIISGGCGRCLRPPGGARYGSRLGACGCSRDDSGLQA